MFVGFFSVLDIPFASPAARQSGATFPGSLLGPSPGTPAPNTTITSAPTPSNVRGDDTSK